jgi:hypothetical protein
MYAADDQHSILGLNFAGCIGRQLSRGSIDLTRFQRASESSRQSTRRGRDDIIQCGRVGLEGVGRHFIVLCYRAMDPEQNGILLRRKPCAPQWAFYALNSHIGYVRRVRHAIIILTHGALPSSERLSLNASALFLPRSKGEITPEAPLLSNAAC